MKKAVYLFYGIVCYLVFLAVFLYFIAFTGNLLVSQSVDNGIEAPLIQALISDLALIALFGISHSVMARPSFKRWWTRIIPKELERSSYVLVACLLILLLCLEWRPIPNIIWDASGSILGTVLWIGFWLGWGIVLISTYLINHFDLFGLRQVYLFARDRSYTPVKFIVRGPYHMVRHPLMLGLIIAFWCIPTMSIGHLLLAVGMSIYILIGIQYEERDLGRVLGADYLAYKEKTAMLLPIPHKG